MEAIRKICSTEQGKLTLQLPHSFWNCEVEVIVGSDQIGMLIKSIIY